MDSLRTGSLAAVAWSPIHSAARTHLRSSASHPRAAREGGEIVDEPRRDWAFRLSPRSHVESERRVRLARIATRGSALPGRRPGSRERRAGGGSLCLIDVWHAGLVAFASDERQGEGSLLLRCLVKDLAAGRTSLIGRSAGWRAIWSCGECGVVWKRLGDGRMQVSCVLRSSLFFVLDHQAARGRAFGFSRAGSSRNCTDIGQGACFVFNFQALDLCSFLVDRRVLNLEDERQAAGRLCLRQGLCHSFIVLTLTLWACRPLLRRPRTHAALGVHRPLATARHEPRWRRGALLRRFFKQSLRCCRCSDKLLLCRTVSTGFGFNWALSATLRPTPTSTSCSSLFLTACWTGRSLMYREQLYCEVDSLRLSSNST